MKIRSVLPLVSMTIIGLAPDGNELLAQSSGLDFSYGRWWRDGGSSETYSASLYRPWFGPFTYGLGLTVLNDRVVSLLYHKNLNLDVSEFGDRNPTAENIAVVIWEQLERALPGRLKKVVLWETPRNYVEYRGSA